MKVNRTAWEAASEKHVREYQELLQLARDQSSLVESELNVLRPLLQVPNKSVPTLTCVASNRGLKLGVKPNDPCSIHGLQAEGSARRVNAVNPR